MCSTISQLEDCLLAGISIIDWQYLIQFGKLCVKQFESRSGPMFRWAYQYLSCFHKVRRIHGLLSGMYIIFEKNYTIIDFNEVYIRIYLPEKVIIH